MNGKRLAGAFLSGLVFALGLGVSGMTQPSKVIGFLDLFGGAWDPSLALVMAGAIGVHLPLYRWARRRAGAALVAGPALEECGGDADDELLAADANGESGRRRRSVIPGAALFGVGWGLGGYCPGPALVGLVTFAPGLLVFVGAMLGGMAIFRLLTVETTRWALSSSRR